MVVTLVGNPTTTARVQNSRSTDYARLHRPPQPWVFHDYSPSLPMTTRTTRRNFLRTGSLAAVAATVGPSGWRFTKPHWPRPPQHPTGGSIDDPDFKGLALGALDAAKAAGAIYADVRFTVTRRQRVDASGLPHNWEISAAGIRALTKEGAWGFAAHSEWTPDTVAWLGKTAVDFARASAWPGRPSVDLGERPAAAVGSWSMPVKRDPFTVSDEEKLTVIRELFDKAKKAAVAHGSSSRDVPSLELCFYFERQERVFASTDGSFTRQTVYNTFGDTPYEQSHLVLNAKRGETLTQYRVPLVSPSGVGFEVFDEINVEERISEWQSKAHAQLTARKLPSLGRYDIVFDATAMAELISRTLGPKLEIDRALGYDASSVPPPLEHIMGVQAWSPLVSITADRGMVVGAATVQWDDDGVTPQTFPVVREGAVVDYATSREFAGALAPWYRSHKQPVRSHGCAVAEDASRPPSVFTPNLQLHPGSADATFDDLVAGLEDGLAVEGGRIFSVDPAGDSGTGRGEIVHIVKQGKRVAMVNGATYLFRAKELWKNVVALGGASSAATRGFSMEKTQPAQRAVHSVRAVAARVKDVHVTV